MSRVTKEKGITLIALVVTIVILIILSTVTITLLFGENGIIKRAQTAKELTNQSIIKENQELSNMDNNINKILSEEYSDTAYIDNSIVEPPDVSNGIIPVKYINGIGWVKTDITDKNWYNYEKKEWANAVLGDSTFILKDGQEVLDEDLAYSMLVWIPRYAYKISSQYHTGGTEAGKIEIAFIDTENKGKDGKTTYSTKYPEATEGNNTGMSDYVVHPAFNYGENALAGFWVGKYETSHVKCTAEKASGETSTNVPTLKPMIKAGVTSWRNIQVNNMFTVCKNMKAEGNNYGLVSEEVDPHLMKNSEWGAVAYLSQSAQYGKGSEVWINNSSAFITGNAGNSSNATIGQALTNAYDTKNGQNASTTGNITGIYDMSGGAWEYVAGYVNNENTYLKYANTLIDDDIKYRDVYMPGEVEDSDVENYKKSNPDNGYYGDAVYETSNSGTGNTSWYRDYSHFPRMQSAFFIRGGGNSYNSSSGIFYFDFGTSEANSNFSFRVVIPIV